VILILEDDPKVATLLDDLVHGLGETCEITSSVDDAYRRVMEIGSHFTLGLVDLRIKGEERGGLRLIEMIRVIEDPEKADLPIVLMTGDPEFTRNAQAISTYGITSLLSKPFSPDSLEEAIVKYSRKDQRPYIMVVEDDSQLAITYRRALRRAGFNSYWFGSAEDALKAIETNNPSLILIDLRLPEMGGQELALELRARGITCPLVAMTGFSDKPTNLESVGFSELLIKPLGLQALTDAVQRNIQPQPNPACD
jgi:DNA-binding NtrC family response regulator